MQEFNKHLDFEGYYCCFIPALEIEYPQLDVLDFVDWSNETREVKTRIVSYEEADNPSKIQVETLDFIINNQNKILQSIYRFHLNFVFPTYNRSIDIEEDEIVNDISELGRVYGLEGVEIPHYSSSGSYYFLLKFDFCYDDHGIYFVFEDTDIIDSFGMGDQNYNAIEIYQEGLANQNGEPLTIYLYEVPGKAIFSGQCTFDEEINFALKKGAHRVSIICDGKEERISFYVPEDVEKFSLRQTLTMK